MKQKILGIIILVALTVFGIAYLCKAQDTKADTITLKHTIYTTTYSKKLNYPVEVKFWVTKAMVTCAKPLPRKDQFAPDPQLPKETDLNKAYVGSGMDRGHMMPCIDNECGTPLVETECFYFSNMAPQIHNLNAGTWKTLETKTNEYAKKYDSVMVWCGSLGVLKTFGILSIPKQCWKVIYIKKTKQYEAYLFDNVEDKVKSHDLSYHLSSVDNIQKITGFKFICK